MADNGPTHTFTRAKVMLVDPVKMTPVHNILTDVAIDQLGVTGTIEHGQPDAGRTMFHPMHRVLLVLALRPDDPA